METQQIKEEFKQILADVMKDGVSPDEAHSSARIILQESGKDRRTILMNQSRQNGNGYHNGNGSNGNGVQLATWKQKKTLQNMGIRYDANISKSEASRLLDEAFAKQNGQQ
mgnify:FL=1